MSHSNKGPRSTTHSELRIPRNFQVRINLFISILDGGHQHPDCDCRNAESKLGTPCWAWRLERMAVATDTNSKHQTYRVLTGPPASSARSECRHGFMRRRAAWSWDAPKQDRYLQRLLLQRHSQKEMSRVRAQIGKGCKCSNSGLFGMAGLHWIVDEKGLRSLERIFPASFPVSPALRTRF